MMCDRCVKKSVCKLCDGSNIQGCIEFEKSRIDELQEIQEEINCIYVMQNVHKGDAIVGRSYRNGEEVKKEILAIINSHLDKLKDRGKW